MAFTTGQSMQQVITAITGANPYAQADALVTCMATLALGQATPIGTAVLCYGALIKCTTGYGNTLTPITPIYSYNANPT